MAYMGALERRKKHYEEMARKAEYLAMTASDHAFKQEFLRIAAAWRRLAQKIGDWETETGAIVRGRKAGEFA